MYSPAETEEYSHSIGVLLLVRHVGAGQIAVTDRVDGLLTRAVEAELRRNALDTVGRVDVLDQRDLEAGGTALTGGDGRVGEEVFPDLFLVSRDRSKRKREERRTRNHRLPYLASTFSRLPIQLRYHRHSVAE